MNIVLSTKKLNYIINKGVVMKDPDFYLLLDLAFDNPTEDHPGILGNVQFFKDRGNWCYSLPVSAWDISSVTIDLCNLLKDKE